MSSAYLQLYFVFVCTKLYSILLPFSNEVTEKLQEMQLERRSLDNLNATVHGSASDILQHADECVKKKCVL